MMSTTFTDVNWHIKQLVLGTYIVCIWFFSTSTTDRANGSFPEPGLNWKSVLFVLFIYFGVYAISIFLDTQLVDNSTPSYAST